MDIVLCGNCGWFGSSTEIISKPVSPTNASLKVIVESNGLVCKCCPNCKDTALYHKPIGATHRFATGSMEIQPHEVIQPQPTRVAPTPPEPRQEDLYDVSRAPTLPDIEPEIEVTGFVNGAEEEEDVELTADIVTEVLQQAGRHGQNKESVAKDLADGLSQKNKKLIAEIAEVPVEDLVDSPPKPKRPAEQREPVKRRTFKCDICGDDFESKFRTSRCKKCTDQYMEMMVPK